MLHEIDSDLLKCEKALQEMQSQYPKIARQAADARYIYDQAYADAVIAIASQEFDKKPTVPVLEAMAVKRVSEQQKAAREAESDLDAAKKHLATLETIVSSVQTRAGILRTESNLNRYST